MQLINDKNTRSFKAFKGTLVSYLDYGALILLQILLAPIVLKYAGKEVLGAYAIIGQINGYLALLDLGFIVAANRHLPQTFWKDDELKSFSSVFITTRTFILYSNIAISIIILIISYNIKYVFNLSEELNFEARYALYLLAVWAIVRSPLQIFINGLIAAQELSTVKVISIVGNVIRIISAIFLVTSGYGLIGLILATIIMELTTFYLHRKIFLKNHTQLRLAWGIRDKSLFRQMFLFGIQALIISIAVRLVLYTDNIIVGYLFGTAAASMFYVTQMPTVIMQLLSWQFVDNTTPAINELFSKKEYKLLRELFNFILKVTLIVLIPAALLIMMFTKNFISVWVGIDHYGGDSLAIGLGVVTILVALDHMFTSYIFAHGKIKTLSYLSICEGILKILLSFILGRAFGISGIIWATVIMKIPTFSFLVFKCLKILQLQMSDIYIQSIKPLLKPVLVLIVIIILIKILGNHTIEFLIVMILISLVIYSFLIINYALIQSERERLKGLIKTLRY